MPTLHQAFERGLSLLQGLPHSRVEAKLLLLKAASVGEEQFYSSPERTLSRKNERLFFGLVARRLAGVPLAYLVGEREFWSIPFKVSPGVLIPRPETELVVEKALELSSRTDELIIDMGTGCGNIALALAQELPRSRVFAVDVSLKALRLAKENAACRNTGLITFVRSDVFSGLEKTGIRGRCDFILSNPPYISEEDWEDLPPEVRDHEPKKALVAGKTGLEFIRRLITGAIAYLKPGGYLIFEIGYGQKEGVLALFEAGWDCLQAADDLSGIPRVILARKKTVLQVL